MTDHGTTPGRALTVTLGLALLLGANSATSGQTTIASVTADSLQVVKAVRDYQQALAAGDSAAALALLAADAVILESGGIETRAEYRSHHLASDIEFTRAVKPVEGPLRVQVRGDVAWAASTSLAQGQFRGRPVNSVGAELMVLTRSGNGWTIAAIHWSSRARRSVSGPK